MRDDPLRMLRAVRFETTLTRPEKPFAMTQDLEEAIRNNAGWLESISAERKREEFEKILVSENVASGLRALVRLGLMPYVVPEFMETIDVEQETEFHHKDVFEHTLIVVSSIEAEPILRKAAFFHDIGKPRTLSTSTAAPTAGRRARGRAPRRGVRALRRAHYPQEDPLLRPRERRGRHRAPGDATPRLPQGRRRRRRPPRRQPHASLRVRREQGPWSDAAVRRFIRDTTSRAVKRASERGHAPQARQGGYHGERPAPEAHRRRVLAQPQEQGRGGKGRGRRREAGEPLERQRPHGAVRTGSRALDQGLKDYLQNEVVEGRLGKDDKERARWLAETYAREHDILEE